jgi:hypothetical protein
MIYLVLSYLLFQCLFDQWGTNEVNSKVIYFAFQYGWVAALCLIQMREGRYTGTYLLAAVIMVILTINELTWINASVTTYAMMTEGPPVYTLSLLAVVLFFWSIISKKLQWGK